MHCKHLAACRQQQRNALYRTRSTAARHAYGRHKTRAQAACTTHADLGWFTMLPLVLAPAVEPGHHARGQAPVVSLRDRARACGKHIYC